MNQTYLEKLSAVQARHQSWLCVGLDPMPERMPIQTTHQWDEPVLPFCKAIIDATADIACAYKPNLGFFLQWGAAGMVALERTIAYVPQDIPVIVDCKAGDIGHTQGAWAKGIFDSFGADAFVVNPYVGSDAVISAIDGYPTKGIYVLARTSNPSATDFQGRFDHPHSLSRQVISAAAGWNNHTHSNRGAVGLVVGATYPQELEQTRALVPDAPFLIPGIGAQGGNLEAAVRFGSDIQAGPLISASRSIIYAGSGYDFADKAREAALALRHRINTLRAEAN